MIQRSFHRDDEAHESWIQGYHSSCICALRHTAATIDKGLVLLLRGSAKVGSAKVPDLAREAAVTAAVEEMVRLPFPGGAPETERLLPRYANVDLTVEGTVVRSGEPVLLAIDDANVDERMFVCPADLDLRRHPNPHLGFGHGPYSCVGAPLARLELQVLFDLIARRFPTLQLAVPVTELRPRTDLLTGGLGELPVTW